MALEGPRVWNRGDWYIVAERNASGSPLFRPINRRTGATDWPVCYADGRVAYDRPEAIPACVRSAVEALYSSSQEGRFTPGDIVTVVSPNDVGHPAEDVTIVGYTRCGSWRIREHTHGTTVDIDGRYLNKATDTNPATAKDVTS